MARNRVIPNILYGTLGLATVGFATFYAVRAVRSRRHGEDDPMLSLRRASRKVGRAAQDAAEQVGKNVKRGVRDTGEALAEAGNEFQSAKAPAYKRI